MPIRPIGGKPCSCVDPYHIESDIGGWEWTGIMIFPGIKQIIYNYIRVLWDETGVWGEFGAGSVNGRRSYSGFTMTPFTCSGYPMHRENRENGQKNFPVRENTGNMNILPKHMENAWNLVCSGCKFPDFKGKRYFEICSENLQKFVEAW